jgi:hypothetical protein
MYVHPIQTVWETNHMNLYHSQYGGTHSAVPQFTVRGNSIYAKPGMHGAGVASSAQPWFKMKGNKIYSTIHNPSGHSVLPQYEIRGNKVFTTVHHPDGLGHMPVYTMR